MISHVLRINLSAIGVMFCIFQSMIVANANATSITKQTVERVRSYIERPLSHAPKNACRELIESGNKHALEVLSNWDAGGITHAPDPFRVSVGSVFEGQEPSLVVLYLERKTDVNSVRIREVWMDQDAIIDEIYPLPSQTVDARRPKGPVDPVLYNLVLPVTVRERFDIRKSEPAWNRWARAADSDEPDVKGQPPLYISEPSDQRIIWVSLLDEQGHESRIVRLGCWRMLGRSLEEDDHGLDGNKSR